MAVRAVRRMGDPILQRPSAPVAELDTPELHALIEDLWDTMEAREGVGIAAPQIGVGLRVVVFGIEHSPRYPDAPAVPRTVLINPEIRPLEETLEWGWEGCLSLPGMRGRVPRLRRLGYRGVDARGRAVAGEAQGFHARVIQHECDHIDGRLYPQRMAGLADFGFEEELSLAGRLGPLHC